MNSEQCTIIPRNTYLGHERMTSVIYNEEFNHLVSCSKLHGTRRRTMVQFFNLSKSDGTGRDLVHPKRGSYPPPKLIEWNSDSFLCLHAKVIFLVSISEDEENKLEYQITHSYYNSGCSGNFFIDLMKLNNEHFVTMDYFSMGLFSINHKTPIRKFVTSATRLNFNRFSLLRKSKNPNTPNRIFFSGMRGGGECVSVCEFDDRTSNITFGTIVWNNRLFIVWNPFPIFDFSSYYQRKENREIIVVIHMNSQISFASVNTGKLIREIPTLTDFPRSLEIFQDKYLFVGKTNGILEVFDLRRGMKKIGSSMVHSYGQRINQVCVIGRKSSGILVATCGNDFRCHSVFCRFPSWAKSDEEDVSERISFVKERSLLCDDEDGEVMEMNNNNDSFVIKFIDGSIIRCFKSLLN